MPVSLFWSGLPQMAGDSLAALCCADSRTDDFRRAEEADADICIYGQDASPQADTGSAIIMRES